MESEDRAAEFKAAVGLVSQPSDSDLLKEAIVGLEDDPGVHQAFQARTRDIDPGVALICLHRNDDRVTLDPAKDSPGGSDVGRAPDAGTVRELLRRTIYVHASTRRLPAARRGATHGVGGNERPAPSSAGPIRQRRRCATRSKLPAAPEPRTGFGDCDNGGKMR